MHQQIHDALKKAFQLGQTYWQQADSDSFIQHRKSDETHAQFLKLCEDTLSNLTEKDQLQAEGKHPAPQPSPTPQPAPSAAAAVAIKAMGYGGSTGINDYLMSDGTVQAMRPSEVKWAPQPSPTPQADSQPALDRDRIREIFMEHGFTVKEGQTDLKQYVYDAADALLRAARAPADNGAAPAGGANWQDISTAPKDGTRFVAVGQNYGLDSETQHTCIAQWLAGCWIEVSDWNGASKLKYLTHWMPLPPLPGNAARKQGGST